MASVIFTEGNDRLKLSIQVLLVHYTPIIFTQNMADTPGHAEFNVGYHHNIVNCDNKLGNYCAENRILAHTQAETNKYPTLRSSVCDGEETKPHICAEGH